jgi:hypothetical protein
MTFERQQYKKSIANVGSILAVSTDKLVAMRHKSLPEVDTLVKMSIDVLALLGHTMCELSLRRRDAIKPNLHKDYGSLCASQVPVTGFLFVDNLQMRLNDIRGSKKISKSLFKKDLAKPNLEAGFQPDGQIKTTILAQTTGREREILFHPRDASGSNTHRSRHPFCP